MTKQLPKDVSSFGDVEEINMAVFYGTFPWYACNVWCVVRTCTSLVLTLFHCQFCLAFLIWHLSWMLDVSKVSRTVLMVSFLGFGRSKEAKLCDNVLCYNEGEPWRNNKVVVLWPEGRRFKSWEQLLNLQGQGCIHLSSPNPTKWKPRAQSHPLMFYATIWSTW